MRQAGVLAAAGLVAFESMIERLADDHANAGQLANFLESLAGVSVVNPEPATNIVIFDVVNTGKTARQVSAALKEAGVLINPISQTALRLVTHCDFASEQIGAVEAALAAAVN
jgi:threonine aldolase